MSWFDAGQAAILILQAVEHGATAAPSLWQNFDDAMTHARALMQQVHDLVTC
jgi:hypothetical protein